MASVSPSSPSSSSASVELRRSCEQCRTLHRPCDGEMPTCGLCAARGLQCDRRTRVKPGPRTAASTVTVAASTPAPAAGAAASALAAVEGTAKSAPSKGTPSSKTADGDRRSQRRGSAGGATTTATTNATAGKAGSRGLAVTSRAAVLSSAAHKSSSSSKSSSSYAASFAKAAGGRRAGRAPTDVVHVATPRLALGTSHLLESDQMNGYHELYRRTAGSIFRPFDIASLAEAMRINPDTADESELASKFLAYSIVCYGARKVGDLVTSRAASDRALSLAESRLSTSTHPYVAASHTVLGTVTIMDDDSVKAAVIHRRAYLSSRRAVGATPRGEHDTTLDTMHLINGARLFGLASSAAEAIALMNECGQLEQGNPVGRVFYQYCIVHQYVLEAYRCEVAGQRVQPHRIADLRRQLHILGSSTLEAVNSSQPVLTAHIVRLIYQKYLSVESLAHLLFGDPDSARRAALAILRLCAEQHRQSPNGLTYNITALTSALKVFMDLGMPEEVNQTLRMLDMARAIYMRAGKVLNYARTGRRPDQFDTPSAAMALEMIILDGSFQRAGSQALEGATNEAARAAIANHPAAAAGAPVVHMDEFIDWGRLVEPPMRVLAAAAASSRRAEYSGATPEVGRGGRINAFASDGRGNLDHDVDDDGELAAEASGDDNGSGDGANDEDDAADGATNVLQSQPDSEVGDDNGDGEEADDEDDDAGNQSPCTVWAIGLEEHAAGGTHDFRFNALATDLERGVSIWEEPSRGQSPTAPPETTIGSSSPDDRDVVLAAALYWSAADS